MIRSGKLFRWKKKSKEKIPGKYWLLDTVLLAIEDKLLGKRYEEGRGGRREGIILVDSFSRSSR